MDTPDKKTPAHPKDLQNEIGQIYQQESRRVLATLIRLLGDFDLAEEALHEAFSAALKQWAKEGMPENPRAWLVSTGRFKAIDQIRKKARFNDHLSELSYAAIAEAEANTASDLDELTIADDQLRLIFTCCHPSLSVEAQLALTLREVCGLTTEQIARAFLTTAPTLAQRIVRAKSKIRDAKIPYEIPEQKQLPERLNTVLDVIYLLFNEGYSATDGEHMVQSELTREAIHLCRQLHELLPQPEVKGLLALMLLQDSRRNARTNAEGDIVLLQNQDRTLWDQEQINEGLPLVTQALESRRFGPFSLQAAIAAVHAEANRSDLTDWNQIVGLYDVLARIQPSPVVSLNQAVAVSMAQGPAAGLERVESLLRDKSMQEYHLAHAAKADCLRRLENYSAAIESYQQALKLAKQAPERRFLQTRLQDCENLLRK
ncbi:RNA polymerase sigma factor [Ketobacter sp. MCCC 1A13808]|uniref:RNA polymerase sigma factor n=1 Tax=Ketobacter sp. MCCC 1A13808 TaxID=2602738 RepID=UPI0012EBE8CF|nr:RNA polymerase sigma factor [Ketobacter sp. MCCC 1A13808]MVF13607.1 RNA polymerase sigma factor [Ketobacter sp. MCCC 1A13808]